MRMMWVSCGTSRRGTSPRHGAGRVRGARSPPGALAGVLGGPEPGEARARHAGAAAPHKRPAGRSSCPAASAEEPPARRDWKGNGKLLLDERLARRNDVSRP